MNATHAHSESASRGSWRRFARHFGEMMLAMVLGMAIGGLALELVLAPFGASLADASAPVAAGVMAFNMTVPMVAWMHYGHRMEVRRSVEMAASMIVPSIAAVALFWLSVIESEGVLLVQHAVMVPAMFAVMLWKREAYSGHH
jgi:flagellar biosynthetic protein FliP